MTGDGYSKSTADIIIWIVITHYSSFPDTGDTVL